MLSRYAAVIGRSHGGLELVRGQYADVVLDAVRGSAYRFPRYQQEIRRLPEHARRLQQVASIRLPAPTPRVRSVHTDGRLGAVYVETSLIPGTPLRDAKHLSARPRNRLASHLAEVLLALRSVNTANLELDDGDWRARWVMLEERAAALLLSRIPSTLRERVWADLARAVDAARAAPQTFIHGDLGGSNILIDASTGAVTGIVDWDSACIGDPAVDLAAVRESLDQGMVELLLRAAPDLRDGLWRADAYRATFALQEAIFGAERGDDAAISSGLAPYVGGSGTHSR